jgi:hypothetical protein
MNNINVNREDEILNLAVEAFRNNVPFPVKVGTLVKQPHYNFDFQPDMELGIKINGNEFRYCAEIKNIVTRTDRMLVLMHKQKLPYPLLLVATHVNTHTAEQLMKNNIQFIDTVGNVFINQPAIYIFVKGNRPPEIPRQVPANRAFNPTGLKMIYALLCNPGLENKPFREIAAKAKVALGTVGWVMIALRELGFLIDMGKIGYKLIQKDILFQRWITAYPERLKPKQILGRYKGEHGGWWQQIKLDYLKAKWGGEVAAAKLTQYLHPEIITIYTNTEYLNQLLFECKLKKDPAGEIEILDQFWGDNENEEYRDLVHPMLIYADLIATGNQRNIETANMIYGKYIVQLIRED